MSSQRVFSLVMEVLAEGGNKGAPFYTLAPRIQYNVFSSNQNFTKVSNSDVAPT